MNLSDDDDEDDETYVTAASSSSNSNQHRRGYQRGFVRFPAAPLDWFMISDWVDRDLDQRVSIKLIASSLDFKYYEVWVARGGYSVTVRMQIPSEQLLTDELNKALYRNSEKSPIYCQDHPKTIADKDTVNTLTEGNSDKVYVFSHIALPFRCQETPSIKDGFKGIRYVKLTSGTKLIVIELVGYKVVGASSMPSPYRRSNGIGGQNDLRTIDEVSYACDMSVAADTYYRRQEYPNATGTRNSHSAMSVAYSVDPSRMRGFQNVVPPAAGTRPGWNSSATHLGLNNNVISSIPPVPVVVGDGHTMVQTLHNDHNDEWTEQTVGDATALQYANNNGMMPPPQARNNTSPSNESVAGSQLSRPSKRTRSSTRARSELIPNNGGHSTPKNPPGGGGDDATL